MRKSWFIFLSIIGLVILTLPFSGGAPREQAVRVESADLVLLSGSIYTMDEAFPTAKALAVTGNSITAVCQTNEEVIKHIGENTRVIDLQGKFVTPGIIDVHVPLNRA